MQTDTALMGSRIIGGSANDGVNIAPKYSTNIVPMGQSSLRLNYGDDGRSEVIVDKVGKCLPGILYSFNRFSCFC